jgi:hypothetical protein
MKPVQRIIVLTVSGPEADVADQHLSVYVFGPRRA